MWTCTNMSHSDHRSFHQLLRNSYGFLSWRCLLWQNISEERRPLKAILTVFPVWWYMKYYVLTLALVFSLGAACTPSSLAVPPAAVHRLPPLHPTSGADSLCFYNISRFDLMWGTLGSFVKSDKIFVERQLPSVVWLNSIYTHPLAVYRSGAGGAWILRRDFQCVNLALVIQVSVGATPAPSR